MSDHVKALFDWLAGVLSVAAFAQFINWLIALPAAVYACLRIYEWFEKRRRARRGQ